MTEWDDPRMVIARDEPRIVPLAVHPYELRSYCELKWRQRGVANAHEPTAWFVELIPNFGYRITTEPPWQRGDVDDPDWGEIAFYGYDEDT